MNNNFGVWRSIRDGSVIGLLEELDVDPEGSSHSNNYGLVFEAKNDIYLESVVVRPYFSGNLTIYYKEVDSNNNVGDERINESTISVSDGENQRVNIGWNISPGKYIMLRDDADSTPLMRSESGFSFPVQSTNGSVEAIRGLRNDGEQSNTHFYYFFNWKLYKQ